MRWSVRLGTFAGIKVYVHLTFLILLAWVGFATWQANRSAGAVVEDLAFVVALFACVVLHEYGHALTARRFGIPTRDITLLPIGGVSRLERMPDDPKQELLVAAMGPVVSVAIAGVLFLVLQATGSWGGFTALSLLQGPFLQRLFGVNLLLAAFNLLPAFPMDGGRVLRGFLALRMDYLRATQVAAHLGQGFALLFGLVGLFYNPFLIFIALFVWIGAAQEASLTQMKTALSGIPLARAMITRFRTLSPHDSLGDAADLLLEGSQQDFPVVENGKLEGLLCRADLFKGLSRAGRSGRVADAMRREVPTADASEMIEVAFTRIQGKDGATLPVLRKGELVGLLTLDNVGELVSVRTALASVTPPEPVHHT